MGLIAIGRHDYNLRQATHAWRGGTCALTAVLLCQAHELLQYGTQVSCCRSVDATSGAELWNVSYGRVTPLLEGVALAHDTWTNPVGQGA